VNVASKRPAETAGAVLASGGVAAGIATGNALAVATAAVGYAPAVWTFLRVNGGISGLWQTIWKGVKS
jgi:hypothetical protein